MSEPLAMDLIDVSNEELLLASRNLDFIRNELIGALATLPTDSAEARDIRDMGLVDNDLLRNAIRVEVQARHLEGRL